MGDFTVLVVATNKYAHFAVDLIRTIDERLFVGADGQVLVFTDEPDSFRGLGSERLEVNTVLVPSLGWPDATLMRYELFEKNWKRITGNFVLYLDADTLVVAEVPSSRLTDVLKKHEIACVRHPGYFRASPKWFLVSRSPWGTWETRRQSAAFVPLWRRRTYVAGGVWMGRRQALHELVVSLADHVRKDSNAGVIAKWHDESHLNWWISRNSVTLLDPSWAFEPTYKNLRKLLPVIEVISKPQSFFDSRQD